ncbi:MAG TPA: hypothetical protein V6D06_04385 [Trichocoleus sp.]
MSTENEERLFAEYLKNCDPKLSGLMVQAVDTAKALKWGCAANGMAVSDDELLLAAIELLKLKNRTPNPPEKSGYDDIAF